MDFIIVTGLSGAGKTRAINALEDIGFFCADNIPPQLIQTFYEMTQQSHGSLSHVAVVTDIRGGDMFSKLLSTLDQMDAERKEYKILFLDANDYILINRFKETRRKHPLSDNCLGSLDQAVKLERDVLRPVKERADYIIDTSYLSPAQLKERISSLFLGDASDAMKIHCISFGFKFGMPTEADLVFDVRIACYGKPRLRHFFAGCRFRRSNRLKFSAVDSIAVKNLTVDGGDYPVERIKVGRDQVGVPFGVDQVRLFPAEHQNAVEVPGNNAQVFKIPPARRAGHQGSVVGHGEGVKPFFRRGAHIFLQSAVCVCGCCRMRVSICD